MRTDKSMPRLLLVAIVLGTGVALAVMYRKPTTDDGAATPRPSASALLLRDRDGELPVTIAGADARAAQLESPASDALTSAESKRGWEPPVLAAAGDGIQEPPGLPSSMHETRRPPLPELSRPAGHAPPAAAFDGDRSRDMEPVDNPRGWSPSPDGFSSAESLPPRPLRTHVIRDGDTLERIALRYLDDAARAGEIFAMNRTLLSSPGLLPIGGELKIPPRQTAPNGNSFSGGTVTPLPTLPASPWRPVAPADSAREAASEVAPAAPREATPPLVPLPPASEFRSLRDA
ncbi:MAG: LysM domain-containing protein [Planctomycetota bacterium]|nr:MAG: LysM domain-containing protein [Planctomycetota bacterium]